MTQHPWPKARDYIADPIEFVDLGHTGPDEPEHGDHHAIADDDECVHDWQPINTSRGRAYQCARCWDRTD